MLLQHHTVNFTVFQFIRQTRHHGEAGQSGQHAIVLRKTGPPQCSAAGFGAGQPFGPANAGLKPGATFKPGRNQALATRPLTISGPL